MKLDALCQANRILPLLGMLLAVTGLTGMSSCSHSMEEVCSKRLPEFQGGLQTALERVRGGRALASQGASGVTTNEQWQRWAEKQLKEVQYWTDMVEGQPGLAMSETRDRLNGLANSFVAFHGYAQQGDSVRMASQLKDTQTKAEALGREICSRKQ